MEFQSDRHFQVWDYHVSHARLLIRSPNSSGNSTNQDVIFYAVDYLGIPTSFQGLSIATASREEADLAGVPPDEFGTSNIFRLESEGRCYYLAAFACKVLENELDLFDSSLGDLGAGERKREDLGRVLAHSWPTVHS